MNSRQDIIHASDCDIKFSLKRIKAKITDFSLRGMIRVVLKVSQWPQEAADKKPLKVVLVV